MHTLLHRISDKLWVVFSFLFVVVFSVIIRIVMFGGRHNPLEVEHSIILLVLLTDLVFFALYKIYSFISRHDEFLKKYFRHFAYGGCALMLLTNIIFGLLLRHETGGDQGQMFANAFSLVEHGEFLDKGYFQMYRGMLGGLTMLVIYNWLGYSVGITDWFGIYVVLHSIMVSLAFLLSVLICKRLFGEKQALFALLLIICFPAMHVLVAFLYTDSLALPFTIMVFYCYLRLQESTRISRRIGWAVLLGIAAIFGYMIKQTSAVVVIALIVYSLLSGRWKTLLYGIAAVCTALIIHFCIDSYYFQQRHLERHSSYLPFHHWIAMGVAGDGRFNGEDIGFGMSFAPENAAERDRQIWQRIFKRVEERGVGGMAELFHYKMACLFGDGTFEATNFFKNFPTKITWVHKFVLSNGQYYRGYALFAEAMFLQLQILMLITAFANLVSSRIRAAFKEAWIPLLAMFGMILSEYITEFSDKHMIMMIPMMVIASASGMERLRQFIHR